MTDRTKIILHIAGGTVLSAWAGDVLMDQYPKYLFWNLAGVVAGLGLIGMGIIDLIAFIKMRKRVKEVFSESFTCDICGKDRPIEKQAGDGMCEDCLPF